MPAGQRAPNQTAITFSAPKELVRELDRLAKRDNRSRSNWIVVALETAVAKEQARLKLHQDAPNNVAPFPSAASADTSRHGSSLNEDSPAADAAAARSEPNPVKLTRARKALRNLAEREKHKP